MFRALDDTPCVAPKNWITERFSKEMRELCKDINIPLAENCPLGEKAFEVVTKGTVLGVGFDSMAMKWFLSKEKADKVHKEEMSGCHKEPARGPEAGSEAHGVHQRLGANVPTDQIKKKTETCFWQNLVEMRIYCCQFIRS